MMLRLAALSTQERFVLYGFWRRDATLFCSCPTAPGILFVFPFFSLLAFQFGKFLLTNLQVDGFSL